MSLGGSFERAGNGKLIHAIKKVFDYAARRGMLIVVSAGNDGTNLDRNGDTFSTFCDAPHVICVASVGPVTVDGNPDLPAFYTNFGRRSIDVAAPGGNADLDNLPITNWPWGSRLRVMGCGRSAARRVSYSHQLALRGSRAARPGIASMATSEPVRPRLTLPVLRRCWWRRTGEPDRTAQGHYRGFRRSDQSEIRRGENQRRQRARVEWKEARWPRR